MGGAVVVTKLGWWAGELAASLASAAEIMLVWIEMAETKRRSGCDSAPASQNPEGYREMAETSVPVHEWH